MVRSASSSAGHNILSSNSNSPQQDRLKILRRAHLPQNEGSGGQQELTKKTYTKSVNLQYKGSGGQQELTEKTYTKSVNLQYKGLTTNERRTQRSNSTSKDTSKQKVTGSRVAKTSPTTKPAKSKSPLLSALGGRSGGGGAIRVFVNNRLGSRAEIICSPSDTVGDFKKKAARQLGTSAQAILLKRQGQRALRDAITLEDYEIGNGSSMDYEIDT